MNHLDADEQDMVRERPEDFSLRTRDDVADQRVPEPRHFCRDHNSDRREDRILADMRDKALAAREEHVAAQIQEQPPPSLGVRAASQRLSSLVLRASGGETIIITVNGKKMAQLCPMAPRTDAKDMTDEERYREMLAARSKALAIELMGLEESCKTFAKQPSPWTRSGGLR